jgi:DNA-binding Xre family transcriptional regulator
MNLKTKNRIKVILAEKEKTNKWLAEKIGRDQTTISRWCTNKVQPTLDTLGEIANILNVDVRDLIAPKNILHEFQEAK